MAVFPLLKSGATVQYPLQYTLRSRTERVSFLDGTSQQYPVSGGLRRWKIDLAMVDEQELNAVIDFVEEQEGVVFSFVDPLSGDAVQRCVISREGLRATAADELKNDAVLVIEEVV